MKITQQILSMTVFYKTSKRIEVDWQAKKFPQETIGPKVNASKNKPKSPIITQSLHTICEEAGCHGPGCWDHVCISHGHVASPALSSRLRSRTLPAPGRAASPVTQTGMDICYRQWENESSCVWHFQTHCLMLLSPWWYPIIHFTVESSYSGSDCAEPLSIPEYWGRTQDWPDQRRSGTGLGPGCSREPCVARGGIFLTSWDQQSLASQCEPHNGWTIY